MKLNTRKYAIILAIQTILFLIDFGINAFSLLSRQQNAVMLILFIVQDACLILALSALLLTFFSTYVFQTGLADLLYERFRTTLIICMLYFIFTTVLHIWALIQRWNDTLKHRWSTGFLIFFILQRLLATVYYYYYKRASLRISDPRFFEDIEWEPKPQQNGQINQQ